MNLNTHNSEYNDRLFTRNFNNKKQQNIVNKYPESSKDSNLNDRMRKMEELRKNNTYQQMPNNNENNRMRKMEEMRGNSIPQMSSSNNLNNNKNNPNIDELLMSVGLKDKFKSYPYQLSGGEKQRLAIARALSNNPNFLIMDEPTGNLDNKTSQLIQDLILNISRNNEIGIILATHDLNFANMMDTVYEISDGGLRKVNE